MKRRQDDVRIKKGLAFMGFPPIEWEIGRKRPLHLAELLERKFSGS